jgi:hypothetical protein
MDFKPEDVYFQPGISKIMKSKFITTKTKGASEVNQEDERDCLSDSHRDYMQRYVEYELAKQEQASRSFLRERFKSSVSQAE